jgi:hypothetical protein
MFIPEVGTRPASRQLYWVVVPQLSSRCNAPAPHLLVHSSWHATLALGPHQDPGKVVYLLRRNPDPSPRSKCVTALSRVLTLESRYMPRKDTMLQKYGAFASGGDTFRLDHSRMVHLCLALEQPAS